MSENPNPWWVVLVSGVISALGLWLNARSAWLSTRTASQDKRDDREAQERASVLATFDARQTNWINRQEQELERVRRRVAELEAERNRAWTLAHAWHAKAHELWREFRDLQQAVLAPRGRRDLAGFPAQPLPRLDAIAALPAEQPPLAGEGAGPGGAASP
ncbi:hypothetical protein [Roseomonas sp. BN140053]|uniref:hypothetical protein n=1 Tax=Roseomonas sp. BN140053 TaxID=3391898 RepID=UPI0039EA0BB5